MVDLGRLVVSRRSILQGAILAGAFVASTTPSPTPEPTPTPTSAPTPSPSPTVSAASPPVLEPSEWVTSKCFDEAWTTEVVGAFPQLVKITGASDAFDCRVSWDERIFDVDAAVLAVADEVRDVDYETLEDGRLLLHVPAGTTALLFTVAALNLYPNENIGTPADTVFEVVSGFNVLASAPFPASTVACVPWALEVEADWTTVDGVIVPLAVRLISKGPNPIPANTIVDVITSAAVNPSISEVSPGLALSSEATADQMVLQAQVTQGIPPEVLETLSFPLEETGSTPERNPAVVSNVTHRVSSDTVGMRVTGKGSAYPVTESGVPVSTFEPVPTA